MANRVQPRARRVHEPVGAGDRGSTRAVERALALLSEVCESESLTLTDCSRRTGLPASTALRLLRTLETSGFVLRDHEGGFSAGPRMTQLGASALGRDSLAKLAGPSLDRIVAATGESAYLAVPGVGRTALYVAMVEGAHSVRHSSWVGRSVPLDGLAVGRAFAEEATAHGYVAERDRQEPDVTAIVAPVRNPGGVVAALSLLGPTYRIDDEAMHAYGAVVAAEGRLLSRALGTSVSTVARDDLPPTEESP